MKKTLFPLLLVAAVIMPLGVGAQNNAGAARAQIRNVRATAQSEIGNLREQFQQDREAAMQTIQARQATLRADFQAKSDEIKKVIEEKRQEIKTKIEAKRAEVEAKINGIKDARKRDLASRIDSNLKDFNSRMLERFAANLDQLSAVLVNITSRTDKADARGLNVSSVRTAIASAQTAIANAHTAITAQAGKTYVPAVTTTTTDSMVKSAFVAVRDSMRQDLKVVQKAVMDARDAVHNAAVTLAQIPGVNTDVSTSTIPTPVPTTSTATSTQ